MLRLICTFVVRIWHKQVFSRHGSYYVLWPYMVGTQNPFPHTRLYTLLSMASMETWNGADVDFCAWGKLYCIMGYFCVAKFFADLSKKKWDYFFADFNFCSRQHPWKITSILFRENHRVRGTTRLSLDISIVRKENLRPKYLKWYLQSERQLNKKKHIYIQTAEENDCSEQNNEMSVLLACYLNKRKLISVKLSKSDQSCLNEPLIKWLIVTDCLEIIAYYWSYRRPTSHYRKLQPYTPVVPQH